MQTTIQDFTLSLLAYKGALIESEGASAGVLLGSELAAGLGLNEFQRLLFDSSVADAGAVRIDYDAPAFEAIGRLVDSLGSLACLRLETVLRPIAPEKEVERALRLQNGVYRFRDCSRVDAVYYGFFVEYDATADERSGGLVELWINPETRSVARMDLLLQSPEVAETSPGADIAISAKAAWDIARPCAGSMVESRLTGFLDSLKRRRDRDLTRTAAYYQAIAEEIRRKIGRASKEETRKAETERLQATVLARESRAAEVIERYRMQVRVRLLATIACTIPTYRFNVQLLRRNQKADAVFSWNPLDRRIECRCCDACRQPVETAALCDDRVHYLCLQCFSPCGVCSKVFCRACHRRCPRPHTAG